MFRLCETIASTWQVPSGPKIVATPSQIISVMARVAITVSPRVSFQRKANVTFGSKYGSWLTYQPRTQGVYMRAHKQRKKKRKIHKFS